ncbi:MAG: RsmB/NOP family class I SAM-dependent RNA methyltransferase [Candidatus Gracilibacteria bacterium]|nr:RsmB/NOP family class I SAM-dependent RNA methyltransferase [Candidatus Gracilibacteria bacterium]
MKTETSTPGTKTPPAKFFERLQKIYSEENYEKILKGLEVERKTSFRINILKSNKEEIETYLTTNNIEFEISSFSDIAYIIDKKHEYTLKGSDIFYSGKIYIQGLSSMLPPIILNPKRSEKILDVTAAPGSKTTQLAAMINNSGEIAAIEHNQIRFDKLNYNLKLQGVTNTNTHKIHAKHLSYNFANNYFDRILFDAPCSAEGRINLANEKTFGFWTLENIAKNQAVQLELLETVIPLLKSGGTLVYSTCTLAPEENEEVVNRIVNKFDNLELESFDTEIENSLPGITEFESKKYNKNLSKTLRILPTELSEGFFIAKIVKK